MTDLTCYQPQTPAIPAELPEFCEVARAKVAGDRINDTPTQNYLNRQFSTTSGQNRSRRSGNPWNDRILSLY